MAHYFSSAPLWVITIFLPVFLYCIFFIAQMAKEAALDAGLIETKTRNIRNGIFIFYVFYLVYASLLALNGVFDVNGLPPRAMVWAGIPLLIFLFAFVGNTKLFKRLLQAVKLETLIRVHIFRLAGVFFLLLMFYHTLSAKFALFAGLGDMITAIFAYPVAKLAARKQRGWKIAVYAWNIFGIMDIIDLLICAVLSASHGKMREIGLFPFVWFPAFAPAIILFLHTLVFRKLNQLMKASPAMLNP